MEKPFYNHDERDGENDQRCTCSTSSNPPCGYCTRQVDDDDDPACYCLSCCWAGFESDLFEDIVLEFSVCPQCHSDEIVFTE